MKTFSGWVSVALMAAVLIGILALGGCVVEPVPVHFQPIVRVR
jgi:hypothetical protein